jgi:hypothetical protein
MWGLMVGDSGIDIMPFYEASIRVEPDAAIAVVEGGRVDLFDEHFGTAGDAPDLVPTANSRSGIRAAFPGENLVIHMT